MKAKNLRFVGALALMLAGSSANAYVGYNANWPCSGGEKWAPPGSGVRFIGFNRQCTDWVDNAPYPYDTEANVISAIGWGFWMWSRESLYSVYNYQINATCALGAGPGDGSWQNNHNGVANWGIETQWGYYWNGAGTPTAGYSPFSSTCNWWTGEDRYVDAKLSVAIDTASGITGALIGTIDRCTQLTSFAEQAAAHEVGHTYGFSHDDSLMTLMNTSGFGVHTCHVGSGFHITPYPTEFGGMASMYPYATVGSYRNVSGMAFFKNPSWGVSTVVGPICVASVFSLGFTWFNNHAAGDVTYRIEVVPITDQNPTGSTTVATSTFTVIPGAAAYSQGQAFPSITISPASLTPGFTYRLWIHVDPYNSLSETDEGDNWIPTKSTTSRGSGC